MRNNLTPSSRGICYDVCSTRVLTNPAGAVTDAYAYRAFGAAWQGGNGSANAYRYAGEYGYYRDSAAVQYVRARYLNVLQGRWLSADPLRFEAGDYNLYRYVGNEPLGRMDPSGLGCLGGIGINFSIPLPALFGWLMCSIGFGGCYACYSCHSHRENCIEGGFSIACTTSLR